MPKPDLAALIPYEAVKKAAEAAYRAKCAAHPDIKWPDWADVHGELLGQLLIEARAACAAMLEAWPGMALHPHDLHKCAFLTLPLEVKP